MLLPHLVHHTVGILLIKHIVTLHILPYPPPSSLAPALRTPQPPSTNSGAPPIDASKLGMLPKRPVSLLNTEPTPKRDDDELEYAENPFEEYK